MPDEYISREAALADFESCNAENPNWTPQRVKTLLLRRPPPTLRRWCGAGIVPSIALYWAAICARKTRAD